MKKILALILTVAMVLAMGAILAGCGSTDDTASSGSGDSAASDIKIGVILVGDETEGYTLAHINGIKDAAAKLGIADDQIIWKYKIEETEDCYTAAKQLVAQGCSLVVSNSYGHQDYMAQAAEEYANVNFVALTGDYAAVSGLNNYFNAFTDVYESRYVSGVVAGMKIAELVNDGKLSKENYDAAGNVKVGYVGAYSYAEVISGYTAFYLGIKSVYDKVSMEVQFTGSWFDIEGEAAAAETLMADGCVIIGQHADSTGAPTAVQAALDSGKVAYSVGYNVSMLDVAKTAALTSATNCWEVYYEELFKAAMNGTAVVQDWSEGYNDEAVAITDLGESCAEGTADKVAETIAAIKDGSLKVFDTSKFTVSGDNVTDTMTVDADGHVTSYKIDFSKIDFTTGDVIYQGETKDVIVDGEFKESVDRAAPYFDIQIDGIKWLNSAF